jgi:uncharacterized membrane protein (UPF0136 family)
VWVALLVLGPTLPAAVAFARKLGWSVTSIPALGFTVSVFSACAAALGSWYIGFGLPAGIAVYVAIVVVIDVGLLLWARGSEKLAWEWRGPLITGVCALLSTWQGSWFVPNADSFYHLAAARSLLLANQLVVTDPFFGMDTRLADPTSGVIHTILAMVSKVKELDVAFLFTGLAVLGIVVTVSGFWALSERFAKSPGATMWATITFVTGGLLLDFRSFSYPNKMAIALVLVLIATIFEVLKDHKPVAYVLAGLATFATSAAHIGWAQFLLVATGVIVLFQLVYGIYDRGGVSFDWRIILRMGLSTVGILGIIFLPVLPKLWIVSDGRLSSSMISWTAGPGIGSGVYRVGGKAIAFHADLLMQGGNVVFLTSTILAALMLWRGFRTRNRGWVLGGTIGMMPALIGFFPPVTFLIASYSLYAAWRILGLTAFAAYVPLSWGLGEAKQWAWLAVAASMLAALPFLHGFFLNEELVDVVPGQINGQFQAVAASLDVRNKATPVALGRAREIFGDRAPMIAARALTGYDLAGLMPVRIVDAPDGHRPLVMDTGEATTRHRLVELLLDPATTDYTRRMIVDRYGIDYVVLWWEDSRETRLALLRQRDLFEAEMAEGGIYMFRVIPAEERPAAE